MKYITFDDYLAEIHAKEYHGTDDDMPDAFNVWVERLEPSDILQYAEQRISHLNAIIEGLTKLVSTCIDELQKIKLMVTK